MSDKLLIALSARQVSVARWQGRRFDGCLLFAYSDTGLDEFRGYLATLSRMPVYMIVDAVEEDYRVESLPHTFGIDRAQLLKRKLKQHYRNSPYCNALLQGRDTGKRRDDRYLFCALTNPGLIDAWVAAILELGMPLAGIYLLPTVSLCLVEKLKLRSTNLLVVSPESSGLRLTCLRGQKLRLSRLARIEASGIPITQYAAEISNTRLYLHAQRVMTLEERLSVLIVDRHDSLGRLEYTIGRDNPNVDCRRLGHQDIIEQVGISAAALDSTVDALYLHLLGLRAPAINLAHGNITFGHRQHQARRGIHALAALSAFGAAVWCAFTAYQIFDTTSETAQATRQTTALQAQYTIAARQFPAAPTSSENLQRAVEVSQRIGATTRSPDAMMGLVSHALADYPSITLKAFGWKYGSTEIDPETSRGLPAPHSAPVPGTGSVRRQSGFIAGEVRPFRGDYRAAIEVINRYADSLSRQPQVAEVRIIKLPLNISPSLTLSGNTSDSAENSGKAEFRLLLILKPTA